MKTKTQIIGIVLVMLMLGPIPSIGQNLLDANTIAENTYTRNEGISMSRKLIMKLKDKRGKIRIRETISLRKYFGKEKKLVIFYETPTSVKGTAFLTFDYPEANRDDDQWLYLPALRKTRRISAANRGDYFLGTDLTYEDIKLETRISREDYDYSTLRKESLDGIEMYVIEGLPKNNAVSKELGQSKVRFWVDAERWILRKAESWDVAGNFLKTVVIKDFKKIQNIWTYHRIHVINHKTKHETEFLFEDIVYNGDLSDAYFTEEALVNGL